MTEKEFLKKTQDITAETLVNEMQIEAVQVVQDIMHNGTSEANRLNAALKIAERSLRPDMSVKHSGKIEISWMEDDDPSDCSHQGNES